MLIESRCRCVLPSCFMRSTNVMCHSVCCVKLKWRQIHQTNSVYNLHQALCGLLSPQSSKSAALQSSEGLSFERGSTRLSWRSKILMLNKNTQFHLFLATGFFCFFLFSFFCCTVMLAFIEGKEYPACNTFVLQLTAPALPNKKRACLNGRMALSFTLSDLLRKGAHV